MYRLYHKIPKGLDPVANVFKQVGFFSFCIMLCAYFESLVLVLFNAVLWWLSVCSILRLRVHHWFNKLKKLLAIRFSICCNSLIFIDIFCFLTLSADIFFSFSPDYKWFWLSGTSKSPHCFLFINYIIVMIAGKFWRLIMWHCRSLSVNF